MQNSVRWSLSWLLLPCLVALGLLPAQSALADTVFDVSGTAVNTSGTTLDSCGFAFICPFSGTLTVNVTSTPSNPLGTVDGVDITFPGLSAFDTVMSSGAREPGWGIEANNSSNDSLFLVFITTPTPGSLVGFTSGTIVGDFVISPPPAPPMTYNFFAGTISPVPEPSSLGILAVALLAFSGIIRLRQGVFRTT